MSFGGGPLEVGTEEEAEKLTSQNEKDSANGNYYMTMLYANSRSYLKTVRF
jgi:hypothetical protein